ncbi:DUF982 domain-containing protein [Ensifer sp. SL37]|uniref:DUF982 domain-containing protein n=1 Tax=Ensifer sp. SL37 TaxID=2995137 RepID=UPI003FA3A1E5
MIIELPELDGAQIVWTPNKATVLLGENWPAASGVAYFDAVDKMQGRDGWCLPMGTSPSSVRRGGRRGQGYKIALN